MDLHENYYEIPEKPVQLTTDIQVPAEITAESCPECGTEIVRNGRCKTCLSCGWCSCDL